MKWKLIFLLSLGGPLYGALTIFAIIHGHEYKVATFMLLATGALCALFFNDKTIRHGLITGFLAGLSAVWLQALFLPLYFANNPEYQAIAIPFGLSARAYTFIFAPVNALVTALITAVVAWVISMFLRATRKKTS